MERQAQHGTAANVDLDIPDSDPVTTDLLWSTITMASDPNPTTATSSTAKIPKKSNKSTTKSASIDDVDFEHTVLRPRGVTILQKHTELLYENAFAHFGTEKAPTSHKAAHYLGKHDPEIEVFLDGGSAFEKRIGIEYKTADSWRLVERRFSNLAIKYFLVQQLMDMDHDKNEIFLPERWDEESIQPDPATDWNAFPILAEDDDTKPFGFSLFPDAMYWLSLQAFKTQWTSIAVNYVHVHQRRAFAPYMSVEYKRDFREPGGHRKGVNQMACSAVLSQYSRYKLRYRVMKARSDISWTEEDSLAIRHYGLTICGAMFEVWLAEAQVSKTGEWLGSKVRRVDEGELKMEECVGNLVDWVNEIHHWGLGKYCEWVREDVEALAKKNKRELPARGGVSA